MTSSAKKIKFFITINLRTSSRPRLQNRAQKIVTQYCQRQKNYRNLKVLFLTKIHCHYLGPRVAEPVHVDVVEVLQHHGGPGQGEEGDGVGEIQRAGLLETQRGSC